MVARMFTTHDRPYVYQAGLVAQSFQTTICLEETTWSDYT